MNARRRRFSTAFGNTLALGFLLALLPRPTAADSVATVRPERPPLKVAEREASPWFQGSRESIPALRLPALDPAALESSAERRPAGAKPLRVGVVRPVSTALLSDRVGSWFEGATPSHRTWAIRFESDGALFVRVRLQGTVPARSTLWLRRPDGTIAARYAAGARLEGVWSPTVVGDSIRVELDMTSGLAGGAAASDLRATALAHGFRGFGDLARADGGPEAAGPCHNDVSCFPEWATTAAGVAHIQFVEGEDLLVCTGQLLNNKKNDLTPFFLTANHCIADPATAATTEFFWFFQADGCNGPVPTLNDVPRSSGAALLSTGPASDFTLLEVLGTLPPGVSWLGWVSTPVANGTPAVAIHHPSGDFKRISFGNKAAGAGEACGAVNDSTHVRIDWTDGPTEPGSSGSGIFRQDNGQLFGQLHCGPSSCGNETNDSYGGFFKTFLSIKAPLTNGGTDDKSENNDSCKTARAIIKGKLAGRVVKANDSDWYKFLVPARKRVSIDLAFEHARGDIDLDVFVRCNTDAFTFSRGQGDGESVVLDNVGSKPALLIWRVYLAADTRATYDQTVTVQ
jgi:hypothetical protein